MRVGWMLLPFLALCLLCPGATRAAQDDARLLITEIYYDAAGRDEEGEWFEIANLGDGPLSLADYKIGDEEQMGHGEGMARFPGDATIAPGQVLVIARSAGGFRALFGRTPDFEIDDSDPAVPDMERSALWATGQIALANDGDELLLVGPDNVIRDAVNYGDSDYFFIPAVPLSGTGHSLARNPADCDSNSAAEWRVLSVPTPGAISRDGTCAVPVDPLAGLELLPIGRIQSSGDVSPYLGEVVTFAGVVTGTYADQNLEGITYHTLFVQDRPGAGDGDPATSDGIAVFLGRRRPAVAPGQWVLVSGRVTEFYGLTEIDDAGLNLTAIPRQEESPPLPEPIPLELPLPPAGWEALEGMLVALPDARVVGPTHAGCGFAVLPATDAGARTLREREEDTLLQVLTVLHTTDVACEGFPQVKVGDRVGGLSGPLIYHFEQFKLVQQEPAAITVDTAPLIPFPSAGAIGDGQISVASFNLQDYLATDAADQAVKRDKLAHTIAVSLGCPTVVGVQEVENRALLQELANALAQPCGFTYQIAHLDSADVRGIDVALLAEPGRVAIDAVTLRQSCTTLETGIEDPSIDCPSGQSPLFSRPPLQVDLSIGGNRYTIFVNHFKSKRGGEAETAPRRLAQARHLEQLVAALLAEDKAARVMVMGDFNDYALSPPMLVLTTDRGHLANVLLSLPPSERYSYNFGGVSQLLDGLLLSPAVAANVAHVQIVHANSDYPAGWALDPAIPFHSSDHDIPYLVLEPAPSPATPSSTDRSPAPQSAVQPLETTSAPPTPIPVVASSPEVAEVDFPWTAGGTLLALFLVLLLLWRNLKE